MVTEQEKTLILTLRDLMADLYALYFQAHAAHWNVEGPFFGPLHDFFGHLYEDVFASIDLVAEGIRFHHAYAPISLGKLLENKSVEDLAVKNGNAQDLLRSLATANELVGISVRRAFRAANDAKDDGLANKLQDQMFVHDKYAWQLRSHLKNFDTPLV